MSHDTEQLISVPLQTKADVGNFSPPSSEDKDQEAFDAEQHV